MRFGKQIALPIVAAFVGAALLGGTSAQAAPTLVTSSAALGTNDSIDWAQLGPTGTPLTGALHVTSAGGLTATVTSGGNTFKRLDQGNGWNGNFANGTPLLWTEQVGPDITITFGTAVKGAGAQIESNNFGGFTAEIIGSNGSVLGDFTESGTSSSAGDNSAIFIGILDNTADIAQIKFEATNDFAIGPVALNTTGATTPVPEPATLALFGFGLAGLGFVRRSRRAAA